MKNKKLKFLNIMTIVLCVFVLFFGVYALQSGTHETSGSIGLIVHDCEIEVSATIANDAVSVEEDQNTGEITYTPYQHGIKGPERELFGPVQLGGGQPSNKTINLEDTYYFADLI